MVLNISEHLKRVAGVLDSQTQCMNEGHRLVWKAVLAYLHPKFSMDTEPQRGLRLRDGEKVSRLFVEDDNEDEDGLADLGADVSDDDDADPAPADAPAAAGEGL